jgi:hypothetical protein
MRLRRTGDLLWSVRMSVVYNAEDVLGGGRLGERYPPGFNQACR